MRVVLAILALLQFAACVPDAVESPVTAIVGGRLIDGTGREPVDDTVILIEGDTIVDVGPRHSVVIPAGSEMIDISGMTVVPGLFESNGHVVFNGQIDHAAYFATRHRDYYEIGARNLYTALRQGITTIRDTMGPTDVMLQLKQDIAARTIAGSRLYVAGTILNYESLLDIPTERALDPIDVAAARESMDLFIENAEHGKAVVRDFAQRGVDFIKISVEGGKPGDAPPVALDGEALKEMVAEAHRLGLKTTSHTLSVSGLEKALQAGFDALEHPQMTILFDDDESGITDEIVQGIVEGNVYSIPLIVAMELYLKFMQAPELLEDPAVIEDLPAELVLEARDWIEEQIALPGALDERQMRYQSTRDNLEKLIAANAPIAMGTDKGTRFNYHEHANHVRELQTYVELGMTPMAAIVSATRRGAELLGVDDELGTIVVGKKADLVVVAGNPASEITDVGNVEMVFKDGVRYR